MAIQLLDVCPGFDAIGSKVNTGMSMEDKAEMFKELEKQLAKKCPDHISTLTAVAKMAIHNDPENFRDLMKVKCQESLGCVACQATNTSHLAFA